MTSKDGSILVGGENEVLVFGPTLRGPARPFWEPPSRFIP